MARKKAETYYCFSCGEQYISTGFYVSHSPLFKYNPNAKKMSICKECVINLYNSYEEKYRNPMVALFKLTNVLDVYFD